jgi:hypothetical protein
VFKKIFYAVTFGALVSVAIFFVSAASAEFAIHEYVTYAGYTGQEVTVEWDFTGEATFEVELYHMELEEHIPLTTDPITTKSHTFTLPRSGHYSVGVRAIKNGVPGPWAGSIFDEDAEYNGEPRAWWLFGSIAPTGGITID